VPADRVDPDNLPPGRIIEFNGTMLGKLVEQHGGVYTLHEGIADDLDHICEVIVQAVRACDLVLVIGGSSAGARDFTRAALARVGEVLVH
ncbi:MAG: molybdopterin biosynthesis protein, partial [Rhodobacterales bacterium]|nr:molybdopterin biosynthesis protein [Rhodobacterales bacterium]